MSSANRTGLPAPTTSSQAHGQLGETVSVYLNGGPCPAPVPSTIVDLTGPVPVVLREGAVDLALLRCEADGRCEPVDMGTGYDLFDPRSHTDSPLVDPMQRANRRRLVEAMAAEGFANYPKEWWHYTWQPEPTPGTAYDFPVR